MIFPVFDRIVNILGKGEKTGNWYPAFSPIPTSFSKSFFLSILLQVGII